MKKIVMGLAAVAMAASMFAVDFTGKVEVKGNLFNYTEDATTALTLDKATGEAAIAINAGTEKAGATAELKADASGEPVKFTAKGIWFKPVDALKVSLWENAVSMKLCDAGTYVDDSVKEVFWANPDNPTDDEKALLAQWNGWEVSSGSGYGAEWNVTDELALAMTLNADGTPWYNDGDINKFGMKAAYKNDTVGSVTVVTAIAPEDETYDFGVDYAGKVADIDLTAKTVIFTAEDFFKMGAAFGVSGEAGEVKYAVKPTVKYVSIDDVMSLMSADIALETTVAGVTVAVTPKINNLKIEVMDYDETDIGLEAKVSYVVEGITLTAKYADDSLNEDIMEKDATISLKAASTFGGMDWSVEPAYNIDKKEFSTKFETKITF